MDLNFIVIQYKRLTEIKSYMILDSKKIVVLIDIRIYKFWGWQYLRLFSFIVLLTFIHYNNNHYYQQKWVPRVMLSFNTLTWKNSQVLKLICIWQHCNQYEEKIQTERREWQPLIYPTNKSVSVDTTDPFGGRKHLSPYNFILQ